MSDYAEVREVTSAIISRSLEAIGRSIPVDEIRRPALVTNSLPFERDEIIDIDDTPRRVVVPACGWTVIDLEDAAPTNLPPVRCGDNWMDNGILRVEWGDNGLIKSIWSYPADREAVAPGEAVNVLQLFDDNPAQYDAWDIDRESLDTGVDLTAADGVELIEVTPTRANLRVVRSFGSSRVEQRISLTSGSPRVDVWSSVDWHETHKLLKVAFPVDVRASFARHEIQFGHVERSTHHNTSWDAARFETCAHTWVDLSEDGFGVALLNDCKYGHDIKGNAIRLSLLRSPTWPDPLADRGHHEFSYSILPHQGSPTAAGVIAEAHAFNNPLPVVALEGGPPDRSVELPTQHSVISTDDPGIVISAVKAADDGDGFIVRLHEAFGGRRRVTLHIPGARTAYLTDLLERPLDQPSLAVDNGAITLELGPFQLVTMLVDFMREVDR
jgi:alpha-mannosidase